MAEFIDIYARLGGKLLSIEKPARYTGGEFGVRSKPDAPFQTVIAFPDLYEVGMSNNALRILYNRLNDIPGVSCERVFVLPPDAQALFAKECVPLCCVDSGLVVKTANLLLFTLGYELGITGVLSILKASGIPLHSEERGETMPIVIAGGPCSSNPLPYACFIDAFWIGEAEAGFFELAGELADARKAGEGRAALLARVSRHPSVWTAGKSKAVRAVYQDFSNIASSAVYPVPSIKAVQHHGSVEIMRGCPNGCRFCHAGMWYRPMRQKEAPQIMSEVKDFVEKGGYNEISLASLSSGDYNGLDNLLAALAPPYEKRRVSFQLPSLHISTFSLSLLEKISSVRKSSLTFAVETPLLQWQLSINKRLTLDMAAEILAAAKERGYKSAKFYFMIGLPASNAINNINMYSKEYVEIINFTKNLQKKTRMAFTINIGVFVPKPHTPYEAESQLDAESALKKLLYIKNALKECGHKVSFQDPFVSALEGVISRGDERVGELIEEAFLLGARLDAWSEYFRKDIWEGILSRNKDIVEEILSGKIAQKKAPWRIIQSHISEHYLKQEKAASDKCELTSPCSQNCTHLCGVCGKSKDFTLQCIENNTVSSDLRNAKEPSTVVLEKKRDKEVYRVLFSFEKKDRAVFLSHLNLVNVFLMAFLRAGIETEFSNGFNPMPLLDFASPLSLGIEGSCEIASVDVSSPVEPASFLRALNAALPPGIVVRDALCVLIPPGVKKHSPAALYKGALYFMHGKEVSVLASEEKSFKEKIIAEYGSLWGLCRKGVFARFDDAPLGMDYFKVYRSLYP